MFYFSYLHNYNILLAANLQLTSVPMSSGQFCQGHVTFTCEGTNISASLFWKIAQGSNDPTTVASYSYRKDHVFPHTLTIIPDAEFLRGASGNITRASRVGADYNMVSLLRVDEVLAWDGMTLFCEDFSNMMSNLFNIGVTRLGKPVHKFNTLAKPNYQRLNRFSLIMQVWPLDHL